MKPALNRCLINIGSRRGRREVKFKSSMGMRKDQSSRDSSSAQVKLTCKLSKARSSISGVGGLCCHFTNTKMWILESPSESNLRMKQVKLVGKKYPHIRTQKKQKGS
jgi:hypothetical protein